MGEAMRERRERFNDPLNGADMAMCLELLLELTVFSIKPLTKAMRAELRKEERQADNLGLAIRAVFMPQASPSLASPAAADDLLSHFSLVEANEADIKGHLSRVVPGSREWIYDIFLGWVNMKKQSAGPPGREQTHRALTLMGDAGMGKSTVSAMLCRMDPKMTGIMAYHFCKHSDER